MILQSSALSGLTSASLPEIDLAGIVQALQASVAEASATHGQAPKNQEALNNISQLDDAAPARGKRPSASNDQRAGSSEKGRAYRRMPEASELQTVYDKVGTVTGVAKHFGVPRHTAQGWMARLRKAAEKSE
jgi:hypothetical protein